MELLDNLAIGFATAFTLGNILYCFIGVLLGTMVGVLPGLGPIATIAMLLPLTFALPPVSALIMLSGIYYGAQYGGSTTAILVNLPGEFWVGGHGARRLSDGASRTRRTSARDRGPGIILRRERCDAGYRACGSPARRSRASIRSGRLLLAHGARPCRCGCACERLPPESLHHGVPWPDPRPCRHGCGDGRAALHLRDSRSWPTV